jgi:Zn-dependent protease
MGNIQLGFTDIYRALINVAILWMLTTPHEFAHAWVATKLGDDTPEREGRVTLHPLAHIDWLGTTILPFITSLLTGGFIGWGKPVNTNISKLKYGLNGLLLVALAGPAMNLLFAFVLVIIASITARGVKDVAQFAAMSAQLSIYLALFNLLPVPPLDGSKILIALRVPFVIYQELARFGFVLLLVVFQITGFGNWLSITSLLITESMFQLVRGVF